MKFKYYNNQFKKRKQKLKIKIYSYKIQKKRIYLLKKLLKKLTMKRINYYKN